MVFYLWYKIKQEKGEKQNIQKFQAAAVEGKVVGKGKNSTGETYGESEEEGDWAEKVMYFHASFAKRKRKWGRGGRVPSNKNQGIAICPVKPKRKVK